MTAITFQEYLLGKTADFVQEKSEEIELSLSDAIRVTGQWGDFRGKWSVMQL